MNEKDERLDHGGNRIDPEKTAHSKSGHILASLGSTPLSHISLAGALLLFGAFYTWTEKFDQRTDTRISNYKPLNELLTTFGLQIRDLKDAYKDHEERIRNLEKAANARGK